MELQPVSFSLFLTLGAGHVCDQLLSRGIAPTVNPGYPLFPLGPTFLIIRATLSLEYQAVAY